MFKRYVPVIVRFDENGKLRPLLIEYGTGQEYVIDKVIGPPVRAACQSVGGVGERYTVVIGGRETYIWLEKGKWFIADRRDGGGETEPA